MLSYNYHVGNVRDIIETFAQKKAEIGDAGATIPYQDLILWLSADDFKKEYADYYEELYPDSNAKELAEILEQAFLEQELLTAQLIYNMNLQELLGNYREESLEKGNRVLLMPHSQGNMYATESMKLLSGEYPTSIAMIGAANIASVKYGKTDYWTAHDDRVVNGLRKSFPVLSSNVDNDVSVINHDIAGGVYLTDPRDFANHEFIKGYFQKYISNTVTGGPTLPLPSRVKIDENFVSNMQFLTHPHCTNPNSTDSGSINIAVCHNPSGNNPRTISVAPPALKAHLGHGDTIGPCF